jgi:hypothetical protein
MDVLKELKNGKLPRECSLQNFAHNSTLESPVNNTQISNGCLIATYKEDIDKWVLLPFLDVKFLPTIAGRQVISDHLYYIIRTYAEHFYFIKSDLHKTTEKFVDAKHRKNEMAVAENSYRKLLPEEKVMLESNKKDITPNEILEYCQNYGVYKKGLIKEGNSVPVSVEDVMHCLFLDAKEEDFIPVQDDLL